MARKRKDSRKIYQRIKNNPDKYAQPKVKECEKYEKKNDKGTMRQLRK